MPYKRIEDGTDDTDGNAMKPRGVSDGVDDDTEGNKRQHRGVSDGVEDDTEGNGRTPGRSVPPAANPGKAASRKF